MSLDSIAGPSLTSERENKDVPGGFREGYFIAAASCKSTHRNRSSSSKRVR